MALTLYPLLAATDAAAIWSLEKFVWADYRLAVVFTVFLPLILLIWAFVQKSESIQRLLSIYWKVASLLMITVYLMIGGLTFSFIAGVMARILIPLSLWFWEDLNEEKKVSQYAEVSDLKYLFRRGQSPEKSKRFISNKVNYKELMQIPSSVKKIGVFLNEDIEVLELIVNLYQLDFVQLHGDESVSYCNELSEKGIKVVKAFSIKDKSDFKIVEDYVSACELFLFDTKGKLRGGNGTKFNWELLDMYNLEIPFLLSGGIDIGDINAIKELSHDMLLAVDINSRFEIRPGVKDIQKVKLFLNEVQSINQLVI